MDPLQPKPPTDGPADPKPASPPQAGDVNVNPNLPWMTSPPQPQSQQPPVTQNQPSFQPAPPFVPQHTYPSATVAGSIPKDHAGSPPVSNGNGQILATDQPHKNKFPLMIVTTLIILTITGFSGSYFYFTIYGKSSQNQNQIPRITPPITEALTAKTATSSSDGKNPFEDSSYENPFSNDASYSNPFGEDEKDLTDTPYENPFDPPAGGTPTP